MDKITKIHTIFEEGAKVMLRLFCNRCYKDLGEKSFDTHNSGNIRKLLLGPNNIDISLINNWINDLEHGLFHGIMGCLVLFLHDETLILKLNNVITNYQTNPHELEILFASILLHDFYRSAHNISENHDNLLSQYFPYLRDSTYIHSNPPSNYIDDYLIIADRLELYRYEDANDWINKDKIVNYLSKENWELHALFYNQVRPALFDLYKNKTDRWIRHGIEDINKSIKYNKYYPSIDNTYDIRQDDNTFSWSVELSYHPFNDCLKLKTHHDSWPPKFNDGNYTKFYGLIPLKKIKKICNENLVLCTITPDKNKNHIGKDHLGCQGKIPIEDWNFIYSDKLTKKTILYNTVENMIIDNKIKITSHNLGKIFLNISEKIIDNILALRAQY